MLDLAPAPGTINGIRVGKITDTASRYIGIPYSISTAPTFTGEGFSGIELGGPAATNSGYLAFHTHFSGSNAGERMRIDKAGNVFFNDTATTEKLHVAGAAYVQHPGTASPVKALSIDVTSFTNSTNAGNSWFLRAQDVGGGVTPFIIRGDGNVGIGTASPATKLEVNGSVLVGRPDDTALVVDSGGEARLGFLKKSGTNPAIASATGMAIQFVQSNQTSLLNNIGASTITERMRIDANGNVGIGTTSPTQAKLVVNGTGATTSWGNHWSYGGTGSSQANGGPYNIGSVSFYATNDVHGAIFRAFSDARIKDIVGHSDSAADLKTLTGIEITDYRYKDRVEKGGGLHKKVIAQQVEKVFPQAVTQTTDVVPDIYQRATIKDGWVTLATDLKKGDRVRLMAEHEEGIHEVLEVTQDKFRTAFKPAGEKVLVYGREVKDFRSVDYEAIAMLNVSATQQIKKEKDAEVKALQDENTQLKVRLATLEARAQARDVKLAAIEKLLLAADKAAVRPVSLKKSAGGAE